MIQKKISGFLFILFCLTFLTGTVRKHEDAITKSQTDPILHKQKMEEIKDGEKGAPTPSWKLYPKEKFLAKSPVEIQSDKGTSESLEPIPSLGDTLPEDINGEVEKEADWWEEDQEEVYLETDSEELSPENEVKKGDKKAETG